MKHFPRPQQALTSLWLVCQSGLILSSVAAQSGLPRPNHVVVVVEENKEFHKIAGSPLAPYLNQLARDGALFVTSFALTHPSQPNYLALFSGSTQGVGDDSCPHRFNRPNLGAALLEAGFTFAGYSESMPGAGYSGCDAGPYQRKHNPWSDFVNVPRELNLPFREFPADFRQLPDLCFVVPNQDNDMHDGSVQTGDAWLRAHMDSYVQWAKDNNSLLIITWDEGHNGEENRIATLFVGPMVRPGQYGEYINHYTMLRTLLAMYDLAPIGHSAEADPITSCWTPQSANSPITVTLIGPEDGATFDAGTNLELVADASSSGADIVKVEFFRAEQKLGQASSAPFHLTFSRVPAGTYWLLAKATDRLGRKKTSTSIQVQVLPSDTTPPDVKILSPLAKARLSNDWVTLQGTASDDVDVARVEFMVNDSAVQTATGTLAWTAQARLAPGPNLITVRSVDRRGNVSAPATLSLTYVLTSPLTIVIEGSGSVSPELNGKSLLVGQRYSLRAIPASGYLFAGWAGGSTEASARLTFSMQSNLVLHSVFVPNPFQRLKGSYNGLFFETNQVRHECSGFVNVKVSPSGTFSGVLQTDGQRYPLRGKFDLDGRANVIVPRRGANALSAELSIDLLGARNWMSGRIVGNTWVATLIADHAVFNSTTRPAPYVGRYTLVFPPDSDALTSPSGNGIGTLQVGANGIASLTGAMADGSRITERAPVSEDGNFPLYVALYGGRGSVLGWLAFSNRSSTDLHGLVNWIKPGLSASPLYSSGFTNQSMTEGSIYVPPASAANALSGSTSASLEFSGGNFAAGVKNAVTLGPGSRITNISTNHLTATIQLGTGIWQGRLDDPATGQSLPFKGVLLQKQDRGAGYFLGKHEAGRVLLQPLPP